MHLQDQIRGALDMCKLFFSSLLYHNCYVARQLFPAGSFLFLTHFVDGHLLLFRIKQSVLSLIIMMWTTTVLLAWKERLLYIYLG